MCSSRGRKRDESDRVPNAPRAVAVISLLQAARKWSICRRALSVGFAALRPGVIYSFCPRSVSCRINFGLAWWKPLADWFHAHPYVRGPRASLRQIRSGLEKALLLLLLLLRFRFAGKLPPLLGRVGAHDAACAASPEQTKAHRMRAGERKVLFPVVSTATSDHIPGMTSG